MTAAARRGAKSERWRWRSLSGDIGRRLVESMRDLDEMRVIRLSLDMLDTGVPPHEIFERLLEGIGEVDALYEAGEYFIGDLLMAGHIMRSVMRKVLVFRGSEEYGSFGRVVIATVKDDIHEIGKNVVAELLRYNGFEVCDLGVDVSPEHIVGAVRERAPHILILSGALSSSAQRMAECIGELEAAGLRGSVKVIVGGAAISGISAGEIGADALSGSVKDCLKLCHEFMAMAAGSG